MSKQAAIQAVTVILSGYHLPIGFDRAAFMAATVDGLADYPDDLLAYVASPKTGVARKSEFIPNLAKMCAHMDAEWDRRRKAAEFAEREKQRRLPPPDTPVSAESRERGLKVLADLKRDLQGSAAHSGDKLRSGPEIKSMAEAWLARELAAKRPLPKLSDEARGMKHG